MYKIFYKYIFLYIFSNLWLHLNYFYNSRNNFWSSFIPVCTCLYSSALFHITNSTKKSLYAKDPMPSSDRVQTINFFYTFYVRVSKLLEAKFLHKLPPVFKSGGLWKSKSHGQKGHRRFRSQMIFYIRLEKKWKVALIMICYFEKLMQVSYQKCVLFLSYFCTAMETDAESSPFTLWK